MVHWQVRLVVRYAEAAIQSMRRARAWFVSPGPVAVSDGRLGFRHGALVRDPDGHAVLLTAE